MSVSLKTYRQRELDPQMHIVKKTTPYLTQTTLDKMRGYYEKYLESGAYKWWDAFMTEFETEIEPKYNHMQERQSCLNTSKN